MIHDHRISQSNVSFLGPPDMRIALKALCSVLGDKKIKGPILTAAGSGFILALVPLPIQVEGTDLLFFFSLFVPRRHDFTHLRTRFPNLFPHHSGKFELPDHPGCMENDIK